MPRRFFKETVTIVTAATGVTFTATIPSSFFRSKVMQMTLITPDYTTASPTTTISFKLSNGTVYFIDSARNENGTYQVVINNVVMEPGDIVSALLSDVAGGIHNIICILHCEE